MMEEKRIPKNEQEFHQDFGGEKAANKKLLISIAVALLLLIILWVWKTSEVNSVRKKAEIDYQALKEQSIKTLIISKQEQLSLLSKPYVWAVRTEMMKDNISQLNLYADDMIKEKNLLLIAIANDSGMIVSSTNKKYEGKNFTAIGETALLSDNNTLIKNTGDSILTMTSPIMGFNKRLGTLFINYALRLPDLK